MEEIIKNKFIETYNIYNKFVDKLKDITEKSIVFETEVIIEDRENNQGPPSDSIKNGIVETVFSVYEANLLHLDIAKISNELVGYYRIAIKAGINLGLTEEENNGILAIAKDLGALVYVIEGDKVVMKDKSTSSVIRQRIEEQKEVTVKKYLETIRNNPKYKTVGLEDKPKE